MLKVFLAFFDQFRAVIGMIAACFLFCRRAVPRRSGFWVRAALWGGLCLAAGFAYVPLEPVLARLPTVAYGGLSAAYWVAVSTLVGVMLYRCYELTPGEAFPRILLGFVVESFPTTLLRYLVVMMWLPELPGRHPVSYILLTLTVYAVTYWGAEVTLARPMRRSAAEIEDNSAHCGSYAVIILTFLLIIYATNGICEWVVPTIGGGPAGSQQKIIRYFCVGIRFLVGTAFIVSQHYFHQANALRRERDLIDRLLREKGEQYEFTRENMEFIRQKCHDLKRQLRALEFADEEERQAVLAQTRRAADFYDAVVRTGNEALDTLLTEKSMLCANRGIRLSCTVSAREVGGMSPVDLYTMLSNALDNAIEGVERLADPEKKTISFSMTERGRMLCIAVENYFDGTIQMRDGYPVTSKADKREHGIGLRSIRTLAQRYGGDIRVSAEDQIFLLQIMLPLSPTTSAP